MRLGESFLAALHQAQLDVVDLDVVLVLRGNGREGLAGLLVNQGIGSRGLELLAENLVERGHPVNARSEISPLVAGDTEGKSSEKTRKKNQ